MNLKQQIILAIETSCDDTSVALVQKDLRVLDLISANQDLRHAVFGGIVPEVASRCHVEMLTPLIHQILEKNNLSPNDLTAIAVTSEPGLMGSLMVGVATAKSLSLSWKKPLVKVHHIEGHLFSGFLDQGEKLTYPFLSLVVSGGHSSLVLVQDIADYIILGSTLDDAAGEVFDKAAKMLGLGYPGGPHIDRLVQGQEYARDPLLKLPRPQIQNLDFSFSGLKTALKRKLENQFGLDFKLTSDDDRRSYALAIQDAIVDHLMEKLKLAVQKLRPAHLCLVGGVSANSELRKQFLQFAEISQIHSSIPEMKYCTDNAAMIGAAAWLRFSKKLYGNLEDVAPSARTQDWAGFRDHVG